MPVKVSRQWLFSILLIFYLSLQPAAPGSAQEPVFKFKADAAMLVDVYGGTVIWEMNSHDRLFPASITKIMSLLVVMEHLAQGTITLDDPVPVSARASAMGGSEIFLSDGDVVSLENLLIGMAVGSANDAAVAVAEHVGGSVEGFVELMNEKARQLGMDGTHFCNPHGLHDPEHYSTAHDVMLMSLALLEYPRIHQWVTIWMDEHFLKGQIRSGEVYLSNTNRMVRYYQGCDGLKTGFTSEAGNGIAATAQRGETRFLAVVLGSPTVNDRYEAARQLLDYAFGRYKSIPVVEKDEVVTRLPVEKGSPAEVSLIAARKLNLLLDRGAEEDFRQEIKIMPVQFPLQARQKVGELVVSYGDGESVSVDLLAAEPVKRASQFLIFMRLLDRWIRFGR